VKVRVRLLRRAVHDLDEIRRYVERDRPATARRLVTQILDVVDSLGRNAERGARPRDERLRGLGYRFVVVEPYLIFFKVRGATVQVHRVLHGHRRYRALL
jgi:toxin ParE1/3/4